MLPHPVAILIAAVGSFSMSVASLLGQVDTGGGSDTGLVISGLASTATGAALAYVVRQIVAGNLVHRQPAQAEQSLATLVARVTALAEESHKREEVFLAQLAKGPESGTKL